MGSVIMSFKFVKKNSKVLKKNNNVKIIVFSVAILIIILLIILVFTIEASLSANRTLNGFIGACENGDINEMNQYQINELSYLSDDEREMIESLNDNNSLIESSPNNTKNESDENAVNQNTENNETEVTKNTSIVTTIMKHSDYSTNMIVTLDGKATATITVIGPDTHQLFSNLYQNDAIYNMSGAEVINLIDEMCNDIQNKQTTIKIPMERINRKWYLDYQNPQIIDALTGGLVSEYGDRYIEAAKQIIDRFNETEGSHSDD